MLPPTVLGFYVLVAMGSHSPLGPLYRSWSAATCCRSPSKAWRSRRSSTACRSRCSRWRRRSALVDRNLINASAILGASRMRTFFRVVLPLSIGGVVTGMVLSFAHTLGEFGVVLMVGGNIPGVTRTISIAIYDQVQALDYAGANRMALLLLAFSFVVLVDHVFAQPPGIRGVADASLAVAQTMASGKRLSVRITHRSSNSFALDVAFEAARRLHDGPGAVGRRQNHPAELHRGTARARTRAGSHSMRGCCSIRSEHIDMPVAERRVGFLFQNLALFPHLTVAQNVQYGLAKLPGR